METIAETLVDLLANMVRHPEALYIQRTQTPQSLILTINAHQSDIGMILGRKGRHLAALQHIMMAIGCKNGTQVHLEVIG